MSFTVIMSEKDAKKQLLLLRIKKSLKGFHYQQAGCQHA